MSLVVLEVHALPGARVETLWAGVQTMPGHLHLLLIAFAAHQANFGAAGQRLRGKCRSQHAKQDGCFHGFTCPAGGAGCGAGGAPCSVACSRGATACSRVTWNSTR